MNTSDDSQGDKNGSTDDSHSKKGEIAMRMSQKELCKLPSVGDDVMVLVSTDDRGENTSGDKGDDRHVKPDNSHSGQGGHNMGMPRKEPHNLTNDKG